MRQVLAVSKPRRFPSLRQWLQWSRVATGGEKRALGGLGAAMAVCLVVVGARFVLTHQVETPAVGGEYVEALVGEPQFINPLYAPANDVDADIARLVYAGLLRRDASGALQPDMAESWKVSEDGKVYTFTLRADAKFHNEEPLLAKDVVFTMDALRNPLYRSPLSGAYQAADITAPDDRTVIFTLKEPSAGFLSTLTVGILPADLWTDIAPRNVPLASYNLKPVGSGPFQFETLTKDKNGSVRSYTLSRFADHAGTAAYLEHVTFKFYGSPDDAVKALAARTAEGVGYIPSDLEEEAGKHSVNLLRPSIPRETALFFNQDRQPVFKTKAVRQAIAMAIDRSALVEKALDGHGSPVAGAVLPEALGTEPTLPIPPVNVEGANKLLEDAGFPKVEGLVYRLSKKPTPATKTKPAEDPASIPALSVTLTTVQTPEFARVAEQVVTQLAAIGIQAQVEAVTQADLYRQAIEPRDYELLLTGILYGAEPDPYPFWHSSQATSTGLNLSGYANRKADALLEDARKALDPAVRASKYAEFQTLVAEDVPAVILYRPTYAYALGDKIRGADITRIAAPADRLNGIKDWYVKTRKALK